MKAWTAGNVAGTGTFRCTECDFPVSLDSAHELPACSNCGGTEFVRASLFTTAQNAIVALLTARSDRSRSLDWIQIGAITGPTIELPSVALRSANLRIQGSGQGSVSPDAYRAELPSLVDAIGAGTIAVNAATTPLSDVEAAWTRPDAPGERTVLIP